MSMYKLDAQIANIPPPQGRLQDIQYFKTFCMNGELNPCDKPVLTYDFVKMRYIFVVHKLWIYIHDFISNNRKLGQF